MVVRLILIFFSVFVAFSSCKSKATRNSVDIDVRYKGYSLLYYLVHGTPMDHECIIKPFYGRPFLNDYSMITGKADVLYKIDLPFGIAQMLLKSKRFIPYTFGSIDSSITEGSGYSYLVFKTFVEFVNDSISEIRNITTKRNDTTITLVSLYAKNRETSGIKVSIVDERNFEDLFFPDSLSLEPDSVVLKPGILR